MLLPFTACLVLIPFVRGQSGDSNNKFFSPPQSGADQQYGDDLVWELDSTQKISWTTELTNYSISLWQQDLTFDHSTLGFSFFTKAEGSPAVTEFEWTVQTFNFDLGASNVYFLGLNWAQTAGGFTSHYFNISQKAASSSSTAAATTPSSTSSATPPASPRPTSASPSPTTTSSPSNKGLKAGLGVGLGLGIPIVLAIGVFLGFRLVKKRQYGGVSQELDQITRYDPGVVEQPQVYENGQQKHELPGSGAHENRAELPGGERTAKTK